MCMLKNSRAKEDSTKCFSFTVGLETQNCITQPFVEANSKLEKQHILQEKTHPVNQQQVLEGE